MLKAFLGFRVWRSYAAMFHQLAFCQPFSEGSLRGPKRRQKTLCWRNVAFVPERAAQKTSKRRISLLVQVLTLGRWKSCRALRPQRSRLHGRTEASPESSTRPARKLPAFLSEEAKAALSQFPAKQVLKSAGVPWPPQRAGFLDLYSGEKGVAKSLQGLCNTWILCFDIEDGPEQDLNDPELRNELERLIRLGCFCGIGGGPVCASFSMAVRPAVRSADEPYGKSDISSNMLAKVTEGNSMALWLIHLLDVALKMKVKVWLENPVASWLFRLPAWKSFAAEHPGFLPWTVDYCRFGTRWRKRTRFFNNFVLAGRKTLCQCTQPHQLLKGRSKTHKKSWTRVAQPYPAGVCRAIAMGLAGACSLIALDRDFDPSSCAGCQHRRIGEAKNPGPRRPKMRSGILEEVPLVEPRALALQDRIWKDFLTWIADTLTPGAARSVMSQPFLLALFAKEYGNFLYSSGKSLFVFRHFLVYLQQNLVLVKPYMGICWNMVTRWELIEPTVHRVPLPFAVFRAMIGVALGWNWKRFSAILVLGFFGIARPGEPLAAYRKELILPRDMMEEEAEVCYLKILKPKTRHRGRGVIQHISLSDPQYIRFLDAVYGSSSAAERLFDCSPSAFRRRWNAILAALCVPTSTALTPGGLRGGGCVHAFQSGMDIAKLLWKMRIKHLQTLESYLQEVSASTVVSDLPPQARNRVRSAAALSSVLLDSVAPPWRNPFCHPEN